MKTPTDHQVARTLAVLHELSQGKQISVKAGTGKHYNIAMGEDMSVGIVFAGGISSMSEMTLSQLNATLERNGIGMPVPDIAR